MLSHYPSSLHGDLQLPLNFAVIANCECLSESEFTEFKNLQNCLFVLSF